MAPLPSFPNKRPQPDALPRRYKDAPTILEIDGYVWEWCPTHPKASRGMYFQHRLVMECHLGRFLDKDERVHHKDCIRHHNSLDNLQLSASHAAHMREHWGDKGRRDAAFVAELRKAAADPNRTIDSLELSRTAVYQALAELALEWVGRKTNSSLPASQLTEHSVREALQGRTTKQAAQVLQTNHQTLRNRFPHLLNKRASPGYLDQFRDEIVAARKRHESCHEIARRYDSNGVTVMKALRRWKAQDASMDEPGRQKPRLRAIERTRARSERYMAANGLLPDADPQASLPFPLDK